MITSMVSFNQKPITENERWFAEYQKTHTLGVEYVETEKTSIYVGGEWLSWTGMEPSFRVFEGCSSRDLDNCLGEIRNYLTSDHD